MEHLEIDMKNLSKIISQCSRWSAKERVEAYSREIQRRLQCSIDWDPDAGEAWIRFKKGSNVLGLVHIGIKLMLVQERFAASIVARPDIQIVEYTDYDGPPEFCMEPNQICKFGVDIDVWNFPGADSEGFNANDLWFASV